MEIWQPYVEIRQPYVEMRQRLTPSFDNFTPSCNSSRPTPNKPAPRADGLTVSYYKAEAIFTDVAPTAGDNAAEH